MEERFVSRVIVFYDGFFSSFSSPLFIIVFNILVSASHLVTLARMANSNIICASGGIIYALDNYGTRLWKDGMAPMPIHLLFGIEPINEIISVARDGFWQYLREHFSN